MARMFRTPRQNCRTLTSLVEFSPCPELLSSNHMTLQDPANDTSPYNNELCVLRIVLGGDVHRWLLRYTCIQTSGLDKISLATLPL